MNNTKTSVVSFLLGSSTVVNDTKISVGNFLLGSLVVNNIFSILGIELIPLIYSFQQVLVIKTSWEILAGIYSCCILTHTTSVVI